MKWRFIEVEFSALPSGSYTSWIPGATSTALDDAFFLDSAYTVSEAGYIDYDRSASQMGGTFE